MPRPAAPDEPEAKSLQALGARLFAGACRFDRAVATLADLPQTEAPEIAFAGRSNVGKSSLLNALLGRRALARRSQTPGRTRELHFYRLSVPKAVRDDLLGIRLPPEIALVDMPGYGYAKAPKTLVKAWNTLITAYLKGRPQLARVLVLIDARHGLKPHDLAVLDTLDAAAVSYQIVCTKIDKLSASRQRELDRHLARRLAGRPACHPCWHMTSAVKGAGIGDLRAGLAALLLGCDEPPPAVARPRNDGLGRQGREERGEGGDEEECGEEEYGKPQAR